MYVCMCVCIYEHPVGVLWGCVRMNIVYSGLIWYSGVGIVGWLPNAGSVGFREIPTSCIVGCGIF